MRCLVRFVMDASVLLVVVYATRLELLVAAPLIVLGAAYFFARIVPDVPATPPDDEPLGDASLLDRSDRWS